MVAIRTIIMNAIDGEKDMGEDSTILEDFVISEVLVHSNKSSSMEVQIIHQDSQRVISLT